MEQGIKNPKVKKPDKVAVSAAKGIKSTGVKAALEKELNWQRNKMRLDHIAYRVKDRQKTAKFFKEAFGYSIGTEFQIEFDDNSKADCLALVPPESRPFNTDNWTFHSMPFYDDFPNIQPVFHAPPEIFVSDGPLGSIVGDWVAERGGVGGVHHIAYQVDSVRAVMDQWRDKGYAEFLSEKPLECPGLVQVFTKPSELTGVIYELISRKGKGFCEDNVKNLMESTRNRFEKIK